MVGWVEGLGRKRRTGKLAGEKFKGKRSHPLRAGLHSLSPSKKAIPLVEQAVTLGTLTQVSLALKLLNKYLEIITSPGKTQRTQTAKKQVSRQFLHHPIMD